MKDDRKAGGSGRAPRQGLRLLLERRLGFYFVTQLLSALNDGAMLGATLGLAVAGLAGANGSLPSATGWTVLVVALFALPFVLCAEGAGQLADRHDKASVLRRLKVTEIVVALIAAAVVINGSLLWSLVVITMLAARAALFSPAKYGILPQQLPVAELTIVNSLVLAATIAALLSGSFAGFGLAAAGDAGRLTLAVLVIAVAVVGWLASRAVPAAPPQPDAARVDLDFVRGMINVFRSATASRTILLSVLGVSWGWFFGAIVISQLSAIVQEDLRAGRPVAVLFLAVVIAGAFAGALLCERISGRRAEIGLVPIGALGMTVFAAAFTAGNLPSTPVTVPSIFTSAAGLSMVANVFLLALMMALYLIPLYASIQSRADPGEISRVVACNNSLTALLVLAAVVFAFVLGRFGLDGREILLTATFMHVVIVVFVFFEVPEFALRLIVWVITHSLYRVRAFGLDNIPDRGPAVLISNHVSLVDALIITAMCRRPIRFVMWYKFFDMPVINLLFRMSGAISIASHKEDPVLLEKAYDEIAATLERGGLVGYFPEGQLTSTGEMSEFRPGIEYILARTPVPVVPMALSGLWGTFFTRFNGTPLMSRWPRHWLSLITLNVGRSVAPEAANAKTLFQEVRALLLADDGGDTDPPGVRD